MATTQTPARLKQRYLDEIRPALVEKFGYTSVMQAPKIEKITVNMGVGDGKQDSKVLDAAAEQLGQIAGQKPNVRRARKSIAAFKLREGMPVGVAVTLRGERAYEFLDRLMYGESGRVLLIVDGHPARRAKATREHLAKFAGLLHL